MLKRIRKSRWTSGSIGIRRLETTTCQDEANGEDRSRKAKTLSR